MKAIMFAVLLSSVASCAVPDEGSSQQAICTISDCPEGLTLEQMRGLTYTEARDNGAPPSTRATCQSYGHGDVTCFADFPIGNKTFTVVCNFAGCDWDSCLYDLGCQVVEGPAR